MELAPFWPPLTNNGQALGPRTASLLAANWPGMHFPLGRPLPRPPGAQNGDVPSPVPVPVPFPSSGPDENSHFHHVPPPEQTGEQLPNIDSIFASSPQATETAINPGDSSFDVPDISGLNNGQMVSSVMETGTDDLPQHSSSVTNGTDVERDSLHGSDLPTEFSLDSRKGISH